MDRNEQVEYYREIARSLGDSAQSTMKDPYIRRSEELFFSKEVEHYWKLSGKKTLRILDIGCGNGHLIYKLSQQFPEFDLVGVDIVPEFIQIARERNLPRCRFEVCSATDIAEVVSSVDICLTERVVINIFHDLERKKLWTEMRKILVEGGLYLMSESFVAPLRNLNRARTEMNFKKIRQSEQNRYLDEKSLGPLGEIGFQEIEGQTPSNYLSTHFYLTRVFHKLLRPDGGRLEQTEFINFFNLALPGGVGEYSPLLFRVFKCC